MPSCGCLCYVFLPGGEERSGYFTLIVFMLSRGSLCYVSLPYDDVGWSMFFDCWHLLVIFICFMEINRVTNGLGIVTRMGR